MKNKASVVSINISARKGEIKKPVYEGVFEENFGLKGDAHGGNWHRQVSLLGIESIDKMTKKGAINLSPGKFAENITTKGITLYELPVGTRLKIGETIQEITQIGKECHAGCAVKDIVGECIMPKEGIFAKIIKGGVVEIGDIIEILDAQ